MKKNYITVEELINILSKFNKNNLVEIAGGENFQGEWGQLRVGKFEKAEFTLLNGSVYSDEIFVGEIIMRTE